MSAPRKTRKRAIRFHRGIEGLAAVESAWRALTDHRIDAGLFSTFEWYRALLHHRIADPDGVWFAEVLARGRCEGIVPLQLDESAPKGLAWLRPATLPKDDHASLCDFPVAREANHRRFWKDVGRAVHRQFPQVRAMCIPRSLDGSAAQRSLAASSLRTMSMPWGTSCTFDLTAGVEAIRARYATRLRKSLRRGQRRLAERGSWTLAEYGSPASLEAPLQEFMRVEAAGWKGSGGTASAIQLDTRTQAFYRALFVETPGPTGAHIRLLRRDGRAIAGQLGFRVADVAYIIKIAYDEAYSEFSPGQVLMDLALAATCRDSGARLLSLVTGAEWMDDWGPQRVPVMERWVPFTRLAKSLLWVRTLVKGLHGTPAR